MGIGWGEAERPWISPALGTFFSETGWGRLGKGWGKAGKWMGKLAKAGDKLGKGWGKVEEGWGRRQRRERNFVGFS